MFPSLLKTPILVMVYYIIFHHGYFLLLLLLLRCVNECFKRHCILFSTGCSLMRNRLFNATMSIWLIWFDWFMPLNNNNNTKFNNNNNTKFVLFSLLIPYNNKFWWRTKFGESANCHKTTKFKFHQYYFHTMLLVTLQSLIILVTLPFNKTI